MPLEFPLQFRPTPYGVLSLPKIPVVVCGPRCEIRWWFLVDTGAEFAVATRQLGELAGVQWESLRETSMYGVDLELVSARLGRLPIRIGSVDLSVRCLLVANPRTPLILGSVDFLDRFVLTIDQPQRKILLDPV